MTSSSTLSVTNDSSIEGNTAGYGMSVSECTRYPPTYAPTAVPPAPTSDRTTAAPSAVPTTPYGISDGGRPCAPATLALAASAIAALAVGSIC